MDRTLIRVLAALLLCLPSMMVGAVTAGVVEVFGAVRQPGTLAAPVPLAEALAELGGLSETAYPPGTILLRRSVGQSPMLKSCSQVEAALIEAQMATSTGLVEQTLETALQELSVGRRWRHPIDVFAGMREGRESLRTLLLPGDVLVVPHRPIAVVLLDASDFAPRRWTYSPGLRPEDYFKAAFPRSRVKEGLLYLPNGRSRPLRLSAWNHELQVVPPGSVLFGGEILGEGETRCFGH